LFGLAEETKSKVLNKCKRIVILAPGLSRKRAFVVVLRSKLGVPCGTLMAGRLAAGATLKMALDLLIKNGIVIDGSGLPRYRADVGIKQGKVVAKGRLTEVAQRTINAEGAIVAPGFVDVHTHYDAQIMWDGLLTSSPWHGVTTVVMGNCGYTLAPCKPEDRDFLMGMFARVEAVDRSVLESTLDWGWETFPEFLNRVEQQELGINVAAQVGHSAVRRNVLGPAAAERASTDEEIARQRAIVREAIAAGAFGFSTAQSHNHVAWDDSPVPSRQATKEEIVEIGSVLAEFGLGSTEIVPGSLRVPEGFDENDKSLMTDLALRSGRPVNWNELSQVWELPGQWRKQVEFMEQAASYGAAIYGVARCQRLDVPWSFSEERVNYRSIPTLGRVLSAPVIARENMLRTQEVRSAMKRELEIDNDTMHYRQLPNLIVARVTSQANESLKGRSLDILAAERGVHPVDVMLDLACEEGLGTEFAVVGARNGDLEAVGAMLNSPHAIAGISDAGAHIGFMSGAIYSTTFLRWASDTGLMTLEEAIRRLSFLPASVYGIRDRGLLREGMAADVVIFDEAEVAPLDAERLHDIPGGGSRLANRAAGVRNVIVGGKVLVENGVDTGSRVGGLLRSDRYHGKTALAGG